MISPISYWTIWADLKTAIFEHETWPVAKVPEAAHIPVLFLPQGVEIELIFALWAAFHEIQADFQTCHIWAWNLAIGQSSRSCTYTLFLPQGIKIELSFGLQAAASEIRTYCQNSQGQMWRCFNSNTWPNSAPLWDISFRNRSDFDIDL